MARLTRHPRLRKGALECLFVRAMPVPIPVSIPNDDFDPATPAGGR